MERFINQNLCQMSGEVIPASTCMKIIQVGHMHPLMRRMALFRVASSAFVCVLQHKTGDTCSAAL